MSCVSPDGAPLPESAAEPEGETGAVGLYQPQSPELCSVSKNFLWKCVRGLAAHKLTVKFFSKVVDLK